MTPATTNYHGYDVFTLPPPAQTWATVEMLNILEVCVPQWAPGQTLASLGPREPEVLASVRRSQEARFQRSLSPSTQIRSSRRYRWSACSRRHTRSRCAAKSTRSARHRPRRPAVTQTAAATPSCSRPQIASATWWLGSTVSTGRSARASPFQATAFAAQPRRTVHTRPEESQRNPAAQAPVQHAVGGLRHA